MTHDPNEKKQPTKGNGETPPSKGGPALIEDPTPSLHGDDDEKEKQ